MEHRTFHTIVDGVQVIGAGGCWLEFPQLIIEIFMCPTPTHMHIGMPGRDVQFPPKTMRAVTGTRRTH